VTPPEGLRPGVILDRDGVLNEDRWPTPLSLRQVVLLPGAPEAVARLTRAGWPVVIATNKTAMGWGLLSVEMHEAIMRRILAAVEAAGGEVLQVYHCPHHPLVGCDCTKPKPGMLLRAARDHRLDLQRSWMVGDTWRDVAAGKAAGCRTILVGKGSARAVALGPDFHAPGLPGAVERILAAGPQKYTLQP
jgi:D-glycero-D-manno-heptose 1,7-bisphosphate phosphatase